jgi:monoamine oxidase
MSRTPLFSIGYGVNAKIINGMTSRIWRTPASGLPVPSNGYFGYFYADLGFQNAWETSRAQPGDAGIPPTSSAVRVG